MRTGDYTLSKREAAQSYIARDLELQGLRIGLEQVLWGNEAPSVRGTVVRKRGSYWRPGVMIAYSAAVL